MSREKQLARAMRALTFPALLLGAGTAFGHGNHEIKLEAWQSRIVPGHVEADQYHHGIHVWSASFGGDFGLEDGYHALPAGTELRIDLLDAARVWNGSDFGTQAAGRVTLSYAGRAVTSADGPVRGFATVVPPEGIHWHLDFAFSGDATLGPTLLELAFDATLPGGETLRSDPIWIVFEGGVTSDAHKSVLRLVEDEIAGAMHFDSIAATAGDASRFVIHGATPGARVHLLASRALASHLRGGVGIELERPIVIGVATAVGDEASFELDLPPELLGQRLHVQAVEVETGRVSAWSSLSL